jgi:hypothetical protein
VEDDNTPRDHLLSTSPSGLVEELPVEADNLRREVVERFDIRLARNTLD